MLEDLLQAGYENGRPYLEGLEVMMCERVECLTTTRTVIVCEQPMPDIFHSHTLAFDTAAVQLPKWHSLRRGV